MAPRIKQTISKAHKDKIRQAALARHAARKAAGLPTTFGQAYAAEALPVVAVESEPQPPVVAALPKPQPARVLLRDDGTPSPPKPVVVAPEPPRAPVDPAPRQAFLAWLRTNTGRSACDPRMSSDPVRMGAELDDRLWLAFQAGQAVGVVTTEEVEGE